MDPSRQLEENPRMEYDKSVYTPPSTTAYAPQPIEEGRTVGAPASVARKPKKSLKNRLLVLIGVLLAVFALAVAGAYWWYDSQLKPVGTDESYKVRIVIPQASTPSEIGDILESDGVIRSSLAFYVYTRLSHTSGLLQAGTYRLSPADSTEEIVTHLTKGNIDMFTITFLPGATLDENLDVLRKTGFSEEEILSATQKTYDHPLFASKPENSSLEGYIYGETYQFGVGASVEDILRYIFDYYYEQIEQNNLLEGFQTQGLSLYEAITLASIVQREVSGPDSAQVAQVFYSRLRSGMVLGSDVTYQYITDKLGVKRDVNFDSPYNTRRYAGLPPGPISVPGLSALRAVAQPAEGDYLYFLSGDDDKTYFGRTLQEHEANIVNHCQVKCQII